ncbi:MAG: phage tail tip lysozyme [Candidatus Nanopelagicales bacterium]
MGLLSRCAAAGAVVVSLTLGSGVPQAAGSDPDPVPMSIAAQQLADIRAQHRAAEAEIAAAEARVGDATRQLTDAQNAVTAALAVDRATKKRAEEAADDAHTATAAETKARESALAAESALRRMARNAYINALSDTDLELFATFAADGPAALHEMARRDMTYDNLSDAGIVDAQRTVRLAQDATGVADEARAGYDAAQTEYEAAHDDLVAARRSVAEAEDFMTAARRDVRIGEAALVRLDDDYDEAQDVYKVALADSLAGGPPISTGPAADVVWKMLKADGFSEESIAGILGNLQQESGVDPTAVQSGGPGRGLAQWSQGGRWDNGGNSLIAFASARGLDPWDARTQVEFMVFEMETVLTTFDIEMYKDMTDILAATVYFHDIYEGSADSADFVRQVRGSFALQWYQRLS